MSITNRLLDNFLRLPKLNVDGSNWVIYKDKFMLTVEACSFTDHIDGIGTVPTLSFVHVAGETLTTEQQTEYETYVKELKDWKAGEAIIKQGLAGTIPDSLFMAIRGKGTAKGYWDEVVKKRQDRSRMVMVDMRRKLQDKRCDEGGDVKAHLAEMVAMREDLAAMGGDPGDDDFVGFTNCISVCITFVTCPFVEPFTL